MLAVHVTEAVTARTGAGRWFYDWQGLLGVLAAFVLVGVTIIYVLLTRTMSTAATDNVKLAREAVQQAKDNVELARGSGAAGEGQR
jgi:hypothetical protein